MITVYLLAVNMIAKLAVVNVEIESVITAGKCYHMSVNYLDETGPPPAHPAPRWRSVTHGRRFPTVSGRWSVSANCTIIFIIMMMTVAITCDKQHTTCHTSDITD